MTPDGSAWTSIPSYDTSGKYTGNQLTGASAGEWVEFGLPVSLRPASITVASNAKKVSVYGSKDDGATWVLIQTFMDATSVTMRTMRTTSRSHHANHGGPIVFSLQAGHRRGEAIRQRTGAGVTLLGGWLCVFEDSLAQPSPAGCESQQKGVRDGSHPLQRIRRAVWRFLLHHV